MKKTLIKKYYDGEITVEQYRKEIQESPEASHTLRQLDREAQKVIGRWERDA